MLLDNYKKIDSVGMDALSIYRGQLRDLENISKIDQEKDMKMARNILINVLEYPADTHKQRSVSEDMVRLDNIGLPGTLSSLLKPEYYWSNSLTCQVVRIIGNHFGRNAMRRESAYGFYLYPNIHFGIDNDLSDHKNNILKICLSKYDVNSKTKEMIEKSLNVRLLSCENGYCIYLGGITRENLNDSIGGIDLIIERVSKILEQSGVIHIPNVLRKEIGCSDGEWICSFPEK